MRTRYVFADLIRNPRRTLSAMAGVALGIGLFCGVLFFVDALSASMTQRAVAPLPIDMQRIVTDRVGGELALTQTVTESATGRGDRHQDVHLEIRNTGAVTANEVTVRSSPAPGWSYVTDSARIDEETRPGAGDNPFDSGAARTGHNLGALAPGATRLLSYSIAPTPGAVDPNGAGARVPTVESSFSTREAVTPVPADQPVAVPPQELADRIAEVDGVARTSVLTIADLGTDAVSSGSTTAPGPTTVFGFDSAHARHDETIDVTEGEHSSTGALISVELARALDVAIGDMVTLRLPDGTHLDLEISAVADLSRARSLFASRRGSDLETFVYTRHSIAISPEAFDQSVLPAYEAAAAGLGGRLKNPPVREIDIWLERDLLDAEPAAAVAQTRAIAGTVSEEAVHQDFLLDNISNTLAVAEEDAAVAKRLFVFLGVPGALLAAFLAVYAGSVLAEGQRREQAVLRIRGASRRDLLRMLTLRTALLTAAGAVIGLVLGFLAAAVTLGLADLQRAGPARLLTSATFGVLGGFLATGFSLYLTGRRSIDREISGDRARHLDRSPFWRRSGLDVIAALILLAGTFFAVRSDAFAGEPGSVYFGRSVHLRLSLLVLPLAVWVAGTLLGARLIGAVLTRSHRRATVTGTRPLVSLYRLGVGRRPWAIGNAAVALALIVAVATSLAAFTASYDAAKVDDARYATGSEIRITPGPSAERSYTSEDRSLFRTGGVAEVTPVIHGVHNVILKSARTSDPANLAAVDLDAYEAVAPLDDAHFVGSTAAGSIEMLRADPAVLLLSVDMADFLRAEVGDTLHVLLARGTDEQVNVEYTVAGLFERLPGFPDGAQALTSIPSFQRHVPTGMPDFFLASTSVAGDAGLQAAVVAIQEGPAAVDTLQVDTRATTLDRDQSSLAALNVAGLVDLDRAFALTMAVVAVSIFVFGLLLQRRREYVILRAQGLEPRTIRALIAAEAATASIAGGVVGVVVGAAMGFYFVTVLQPLFVLPPQYVLPARAVLMPAAIVLAASALTSLAASRFVNRLDPTDLLREE